MALDVCVKGEGEIGFELLSARLAINSKPFGPRAEPFLPRLGHPLRLTLRFLFCRKAKFDGGSQLFLIKRVEILDSIVRVCHRENWAHFIYRSI